MNESVGLLEKKNVVMFFLDFGTFFDFFFVVSDFFVV